MISKNRFPSIALVEPQFAINVGYVARVMANFGFPRLYFVSTTKKQLDFEEASKFAAHGQDVIQQANFVPTIASLRKKHGILVGTTAIRAKRKSNISRTTMDFETFMPTLGRTLGNYSGSRSLSKVCFVFGRDTTGLTNEELRQCDFGITIETGTLYQTLNISHAASIVLYELSKYLRGAVKQKRSTRESQPQEHLREHALVVKLFLDLAKASDFQLYKRQKLEQSISRLVNRGNPSLRETYLLIGLASKAKSRIRNLEGQVSS
jgi:tRNA/rRNA methyltransferase